MSVSKEALEQTLKKQETNKNNNPNSPLNLSEDHLDYLSMILVNKLEEGVKGKIELNNILKETELLQKEYEELEKEKEEIIKNRAEMAKRNKRHNIIVLVFALIAASLSLFVVVTTNLFPTITTKQCMFIKIFYSILGMLWSIIAGINIDSLI